MTCSIQYENSNISIDISEDDNIERVKISFDCGDPNWFEQSLEADSTSFVHTFERIKKPKGQILIMVYIDNDNEDEIIYETFIEKIDDGDLHECGIQGSYMPPGGARCNPQTGDCSL